MANLWCRLYAEILHDPKIQLLSDEDFRFWVNCLAMGTTRLGVLPDADVIAWTLRSTRGFVDARIAKLIAVGLLDADDETPHETRLKLHSWNKRQFLTEKNSTERVRKFRERRMKQRGNAPETVSETHLKRFPLCSVSESDSVLSFTKKEILLERGAVSQKFRQFWDRWVELTGRRQKESYACQAFVSVVEADTEMACLACLERYGASDEVREGKVTNPDKWLYEQARDAFKGTWQKRQNGAGKGIAGDLERYLDEH